MAEDRERGYINEKIGENASINGISKASLIPKESKKQSEYGQPREQKR